MKERLNLWDRFFNRYTKTIHTRGNEIWMKHDPYQWGGPINYHRDWIEYKITDRLTGSETIKRKYLN